MSRTFFHARWIVPVTSEPIENGRLVVEDGRIVSVGRATKGEAKAVDLGDAVILPGLVNAHTHLELTCCRDRVGYQGSFSDWIARLTAINPHSGPSDVLVSSIADGFEQSMAAGVTTVADIGAGPRVFKEWTQSSINTVGFLEILGMGLMRLMAHERSMTKVTELCQSDTGLVTNEVIRCIGISPHAPFSTETSIYRDAIAYAQRTSRPISTHLAETREELQFLADGTGPLRELLEKFSLWDGSFKPPGCSPVQYAQQLGLLECNPLLIHLNYVSDAELDLIAGKDCSIVYCPRSHSFFEHQPHGYRDMLARGLNVCMGTDSLASNDSLSVLDELRFLRGQDRTLSNQQLLNMATMAGARALKLDHRIGSLEPGKKADLAVIPLANPHTDDPVDDLLTGNLTSSVIYISGKPVYP
ncbi:MAG: amidohydrolase family protein [Planctomycetota bacterium]|jgi:cytosine/adenosine deaminase-related metal-dependent hydrolase